MGRAGWLSIACLAAAVSAAQAEERAPDPYVEARQRLVALVAADARSTAPWTGRSSFAEEVMAAMARTPRHLFVPESLRPRAYQNLPLPIGYGQTISQPYIVALMTDLLGVGSGDRVLEVGTGSGYQAAILAELGVRVFTIEIIEPLAKTARERLTRLGYDGVQTRWADGYYGWEEHAPFDGIIVTAAASHVPPPLIRQLAPGGRMVIPVGARFMTQELVLVEKGADGRVRTRQLLPVRFVPLTGKH